jgi:CheY-like chemotaxis protein/HPt (histidine-containing phosphotransfer) domain-containing protein
MTLPFCQLRILVAESDNATRRLMAQTLEKMGAAVVMAGNGREAVAHFAADHFDLVFMGLALPETDGFAATAAIRRTESAFADRVPLLAMTMLRASGERDRCLAAGMDSYIEKPSSASQIQVALLAFTNPESLQPIRPPPTWDRMRILERVGGDENFLAELIAIFAKEKSKLLGQMERALVECKPELLQQSAHDLQDQLNYLGAFEVSETARQLGATSNQPTFMKTSEMTALLRSLLFATELAMSKA